MNLFNLRSCLKDMVEEMNAILDDPVIIDTFRTKVTAFTRQTWNESVWTFKSVCLCMLMRAGDTNSNVINRFVDSKIIKRKITSSSARERRSLIDYSIFLYLLFSLNVIIYKTYGFIIGDERYYFAIDGTSIKLPERDDLLKGFGGQSAGKNKKKVPLCRISLVYDVRLGFIIDIIVSPYEGDGFGERSLIVAHLKSIKELNLDPNKVVLIMDRGYASRDLVQAIDSYGYKYVMRTPKKYLNAVVNAEGSDNNISYKYKKQITNQRVLKFPIPSNQIETLITNIQDGDIDYFYNLYNERWGIETSIRFVKRLYGPDVLNFKYESISTILQSIYSIAITHNFMSMQKLIKDKEIKLQEDKSDKLGNKKRRKYNHQTNRTELYNCTMYTLLISVNKGNGNVLLNKLKQLNNSDIKTPIKPGRKAPRFRYRIIKSLNK